MFRRIFGAALAAALFSGCASQSAVTPAPTPAPVSTSPPAATATNTLTTVLASVCAYVNKAAPIYSSLSFLLPVKVTAVAGPAIAYLTSTCANPPTDIVGILANLQQAVAIVQQALGGASAVTKGGRYGSSNNAVQTAIAAGNQALTALAAAQGYKGYRRHGR